VASLLGHVPTDLTKTTIYDITMEEDKKLLYGLLQSYNGDEEQRTELVVHFKRSTIVMQEEVITTIVCFSTFLFDSAFKCFYPAFTYLNRKL
jgi:hypothetical protein